MMDKIYSRPRIRIPKLLNKKNKDIRNRKKITIILILIVAFSTMKLILDAILPIFDSLCESKAKSIATIVSNEEATKIMKEYTYDEMFFVEKDSNNNITMIKSNIITINEIISNLAVEIQKKINQKGRENIKIALRKFYRM